MTEHVEKPRSFSRSFWITTALILIVGLVYYPYSPAGRQRSNQRVGRPFVSALNGLFANDPRFQNVTAGLTTHVQIRVTGGPVSATDSNALKALIEAEREKFNALPPVMIDVLDRDASGSDQERRIKFLLERKKAANASP